jgi:hypothetical protein
MMKPSHMVVFVVCSVLILVSCSSKPENAIVGKWQITIEGQLTTYEFFKNGNINVYDRNNQMAGKYEFVNKDQLRMDFGGLAGAKIFKVSISGNELTMANPANSDVIKLKKVK